MCLGSSSFDGSVFFVAGPAMAANPLAPNPLDALQSKSKNAVNDAKAIANKAGTRDPVKDMQVTVCAA